MADGNDDIDVVGYRRPPRKHQFKSGQSGNPKGRPKKSRAMVSVHDMLARPIKVGDKKRPYHEVFIEMNMKRALEGDRAATRYIAQLMQNSNLINMEAESYLENSMKNARVSLAAKFDALAKRLSEGEAAGQVEPRNDDKDEKP